MDPVSASRNSSSDSKAVKLSVTFLSSVSYISSLLPLAAFTDSDVVDEQMCGCGVDVILESSSPDNVFDKVDASLNDSGLLCDNGGAEGFAVGEGGGVGVNCDGGDGDGGGDSDGVYRSSVTGLLTV